MGITYLDGPRLRRALIAGCEHAQRERAELNRINVFPVPDGDTGTNLALTVRSISDRLRANGDSSAAAVADLAAQAAILGARGNCGMILSHFLLGFSGAVGGRRKLTVAEFVPAMREAVDHLYGALDRPVEGTMLTVIREASEAAEQATTTDFVELAERLLERARDALRRTPEMLPVLRQAGVVDAGGKGFVHFLEGIVGLVHGDPLGAVAEPPASGGVEPPASLVDYPAESERYRFCTEGLVRGDLLPTDATAREALRDLGDSLIVIRGRDVLKVHIHTDDPERVFSYLRTLGELATRKAEDMAAQHATLERAAASHVQLARRPVVVVTDSACDLPEEVVAAHGIHVVPMSLIFGDRILRDRVDIDAATFFERLRRGERPTTSQPPPAAFLEAFGQAAEDGEHIVAVTVSGALSGTHASAGAAARQFAASPVELVDSRAASLCQGLLALRAAELGEAGLAPAAIAAELRRIRDQSGIFFTVDIFDNLLASGRVGRGRAFLGGLLDVKPILMVDLAGNVVPLSKARGRGNVLPRVLELLDARLPRDAGKVRFGVSHVDCAEDANRVKDALRERYPGAEIIIAPATPVLSTHLGPGAWGLAYQRED